MAANSISSKRTYNVNEIISMLEEEDFAEARIYMQPPGNGHQSDEDSGDEDHTDANNLSRNQLVSQAEVSIFRNDGHVDITGTTECNNFETQDDQAPSKRPKIASKADRLWKYEDLPTTLTTQRTWQVSKPDFLSEYLTPTQLFERFFDEEVLDLLVENTNLYANRDKGAHLFRTDKSEICLFITILIISGYDTLPRRRMYWEHADDVRNEAIASAMSRNRFEELMQYLHICDNQQLAPDDRLTKIRPLYSLLNRKCLDNNPQEQNLSIDETMVPYFGRHSAKQFIRGKPVRFGYKLWTLATTHGYVLQFKPYCGATGRPNNDMNLGLGGSVVVDLMDSLPKGLPHHVTFDNFFTSLRLIDYLMSIGISATGTVRQNRIEKCPVTPAKDLEKKDRGSFDYRHDRNSNTVVVSWKDNSVATLVSNTVGIEPAGTVSRWSKQESAKIHVPEPRIVKYYNSTMGGVDRSDKNIAAYRIAIRSKKWWWPLFAHTIDLALQNGWLLYRQTPSAIENPLDLLGFKRDVVRLYLLKHKQNRTSNARFGRHAPIDRRVPREVRFDKISHYSTNMETQRRCVVCGKNTRKACSKCDVSLHIHCFNEFHGIV